MYEDVSPGYRGWYSDCATGWVVRGSNPGGSEISRNAQTGPGAHPTPCVLGNSSLPQGPGVALTNHPSLVSRLKKE
jgi:hypothetical protein